MTISADKKPPRQAILSPVLDAICCGGLSIVVVIAFRFYADAQNWAPGQRLPKDLVLILFALFNYPHFMASYRLLYGRRDNIRRYPWAAVGIPIVLFGSAAIAFATRNTWPELSNDILERFTQLGMLLLAWHYTGQAWGMVASFFFLKGVRLEKHERLMIRSGLYVLMVWHVCWAMLALHEVQAVPWLRDLVAMAQIIAGWLALVAAVVGVVGYALVYKRTGRITIRGLLAWIAIFSWYWLVAKYPRALPILQISHSVQYLIFPIRVEMNSSPPVRGPRARLRGAIYYAILIVVGLLVLGSEFTPDLLARWGFQPSWLQDNSSLLILLGFLAAAIQIHHYFTDGAVWKISNPAVRKQLFAHIDKT